MKPLGIVCTAIALWAPISASAQSPQPMPTLAPGNTLQWQLHWPAVAERLYFVQYSEDLEDWMYLKSVTQGTPDPVTSLVPDISTEFATVNATRMFYRLKYIDPDPFWLGWGIDWRYMDHDDDGIPSIQEVMDFDLDPFNDQTLGSGTFDRDIDHDGDGAPTAIEIALGTDPNDEDDEPDPIIHHAYSRRVGKYYGGTYTYESGQDPLDWEIGTYGDDTGGGGNSPLTDVTAITGLGIFSDSYPNLNGVLESVDDRFTGVMIEEGTRFDWFWHQRTERKFRIYAEWPVDEAVTRTYLPLLEKVKYEDTEPSQGLGVTPPVATSSWEAHGPPVTLTIHEGQTQSAPHEIQAPPAPDGELRRLQMVRVDIEVKRGGIGNNTNHVPTTPTWRSQGGTIRDVVSVWDAHTSSTQVADLKGDWMQVRVNLGGQALATLPANFVTWSIDEHPAPAANTLETPRLSWPGSFGAKTIQATVGGKVFKVHVDVPNVGSIGHVGWGALVIATRGNAIGAAAILLARDYGTDETTWSSGYAGTPAQQNALRHSSWIAHCASAVTIGPALASSLGYAHENDNFSSGNNWAYESTMDIHNNLQGVASVHSTWLGNPDTAAIRADVTAKLTSGALWIWDGPGAEHTGFKATLKSNNTPIFP